MPAFHVVDAAGHSLMPADLAGRPALINLWATWCGPCVVELPTLNALASKPGAPRIVTISQDSGAVATTGPRVAKFLADKGATKLEPWLDPDGKAGTLWQVSTLPLTVYYDAQGHEQWRSTGGTDWTGPEAAKLLAQ